MKALILAAGMGTRLIPITQIMPKCMVPIHGVTIIERQLKNLIDNGITEIYIVSGYKEELLRGHISDLGLKKYVTFLENKYYATTNNMYSLYLSRGFLEGEPFIMMNADVFYDANILKALLNDEHENLIACEKGTYIEESMKITVNEKNIITSISKTIDKNIAYGTSIDIYKFSKDAGKDLFDIIYNFLYIRNDKTSWSEAAINELLSKIDFYPLNITNKWIEIDNHDDLLKAEKIYLG